MILAKNLLTNFHSLSTQFNSLGVVAQMRIVNCKIAQSCGTVGMSFVKNLLIDLQRLRAKFNSLSVVT